MSVTSDLSSATREGAAGESSAKICSVEMVGKTKPNDIVRTISGYDTHTQHNRYSHLEPGTRYHIIPAPASTCFTRSTLYIGYLVQHQQHALFFSPQSRLLRINLLICECPTLLYHIDVVPYIYVPGMCYIAAAVYIRVCCFQSYSQYYYSCVRCGGRSYCNCSSSS